MPKPSPKLAGSEQEPERKPSSMFGLILSSLLDPEGGQDLKAQAVRQAASGSVATLIDLGLFKLGLLLSIHVLVAALISATASSSVNFVLSRRYVFGQVERQRLGLRSQILLYVSAVLVAMGLNQLILSILCLQLDLPPMPVKILVVTPVVFVWTLLSGKRIIFDKRPPSDGEES